MDDNEIRLECLRLAVNGSATRTATDENKSVISLAKEMYEFVTAKD